MQRLKEVRAAIYIILGLITNILGDIFISGHWTMRILVAPFFIIFVSIALMVALIHHKEGSGDIL
jgi:hypothetical protein